MLSRERIFIGFGSNRGDRRKMIDQALRELIGFEGIELVRLSSLYLTEPVGYNDQGDFLNGVAEISVGHPPEELLELLLSLELDLGRKRQAKRWGPRIIDLDLLLYGQRMIGTEKLIIPHPELHRRAFVLMPLVEIAPDVRHPRLGLTAAEILSSLKDGKKVERLGKWTA